MIGLVKRGRNPKTFKERLDSVLTTELCKQHLRIQATTQAKKDCRDKNFRRIQWANAKLAGLGREKRNKLMDTTVAIPIRLYDDLVLEPPQIKLTSKVVKEEKEYLRDQFPALPEPQCNDDVAVEHAFVPIDDLLESVVRMIYIQPAYHKHLQWFLDQNLAPRFNHFVIRLYYDGFGILDGQPCCTATLIFINLVGLIHHPEYSFPFNIQLAKEHSAIGIKLLRPQDESLQITSQNGIGVTITGQPENSTVPHSNLAINNTPHITFRIIDGGDIPSHIFSSGGPNSVNLRLGLPKTDGLANSICCRPDTAVKWIEQHQKYEIWTIMEAF